VIRVAVTFWNAAPYIARCLCSIRCQTAGNFQCCVFDDGSTDGSLDAARRVVGSDDRFVLIRNERKLWQVGSWWTWSRRSDIADDDILVVVDGDDWLPDADVFSRVLAAYDRHRIWLTYGRMAFAVQGVIVKRDVKPPLQSARHIRDTPWVTMPLRTFKAFLFRAIEKSDLLDDEGHFIPAPGDVAAYFPMVEMAGDSRILALPDVNYVYNVSNPYCTWRVPAFEADQKRHASRLRAAPRYGLLDRPDAG
jgi:glycosyltransferase involved in cell wall biosynthesis